MSQVVVESPERLLDQTIALYQVLHSEPPPAFDDDGFILGRVAELTKGMLVKLGVEQLAPDNHPVMQKIRHNVNMLSSELVGRELSNEPSTVTLVDLIRYMDALQCSVSVERTSCAVS